VRIANRETERSWTEADAPDVATSTSVPRLPGGLGRRAPISGVGYYRCCRAGATRVCRLACRGCPRSAARDSRARAMSGGAAQRLEVRPGTASIQSWWTSVQWRVAGLSSCRAPLSMTESCGSATRRTTPHRHRLPTHSRAPPRRAHPTRNKMFFPVFRSTVTTTRQAQLRERDVDRCVVAPCSTANRAEAGPGGPGSDAPVLCCDCIVPRSSTSRPEALESHARLRRAPHSQRA